MSQIDSAQMAAVYERLGELLAIAARRFQWRILPGFEVGFDLKGQAAGQMQIRQGKVRLRFNAVLMRDNREHFLRVTVAHELAHAVAYWVYGKKIQPHGEEWQSIMALFGLEPRRCHDYDVTHAQVRRLQRFTYRCGCREHDLTSIRHRRIQEGERTYVCKHCREKLEWVVES
ncbi:SprT-like domain-containing protein [Methylohalobius crimeensis]|uniref:SprT-like domain-containing protein n=1 Tax=Methylohalobius crimeensis TaxID=244365 RepID=UPI0003FF4F96|nr:SprT-like domain-containing protein [Methylohalobius crimeensis]